MAAEARAPLSPRSARSRPSSRLGGRDGFTLIEALAAFAILAMLTLAVQRGLVSAKTALLRADQRIAAERVAASLLAQPIGRPAARGATRSGTTDGYRWTMRFEPLDLGVASAAQPAAEKAAQWQPWRVIIQVAAPPGRMLELETVRLAQVE